MGSLPFPEYEELDAMGLADLVRSGEIRPREAVEAAIARIEAWNPQLNAVVRRFDERALEDAEQSSLHGPFAGVPFLLKDLLSHVSGIPTTGASRYFANLVPDFDSELVRRYREAGLIVLGKTNTPEMGLLGHTSPELFGPSKNPWDPGRTPGGSSGGSAAAVAARIVPVATGGDGGGSIRIPASHCGLFGLKPSRGRTPFGPDLSESWNGLVVLHVLSRSVRDSAALLDATDGPDPEAPYVAPPKTGPYLAEVGADPGKLRIAFFRGSLFGRELHPHCVAAVEDAANLLSELGHHVEEASPELPTEKLVSAYLAIVTANTAGLLELAAPLVGRKARRRDVEATTWFLQQMGREIRAWELVEALHHAHHAGRLLARFHQEYDLFLTATVGEPPRKLGDQDPTLAERTLMGILSAAPVPALLRKGLDQLASEALEAVPNTQLFNLTGQPAMSVPLYWDADGLPVGVQLAAPLGGEATLFRVAAQLEEARPWAQRIPPLIA